MAATEKGVWDLQEVRDKQLASEWSYTAMDPRGLWMWGKNLNGEVGQNQAEPAVGNFSSPCQIPGADWNNVGNGRGSLTIGVKSDNTLWAWGNNGDGGLGQNGTTTRSSPTQIGTGTDWKHMGVGESHGLCSKTDGTLWAWGVNTDGQLGQNNTTTYSSPIQIPGTTWDKAYGAGSHGAAIKTDGSLWTWGNQGGFGALAQNTNYTQYSSPKQVGTDTTWNEVVCSSKGFIATKTDGTLWMVGNNEFGALGINTPGHRSSPIQIGTGTDWSLDGNAINSNTQGASYAIKTDGTLWAWGYNAQGQLGINNKTHYSSPTQVPGTTYKNVASAYYAALVTKTDGTMFAMGADGNGLLGQNSYSSPSYEGKSSPIQIPGTNWDGCQGSSDYNFVAYTPS